MYSNVRGISETEIQAHIKSSCFARVRRKAIFKYVFMYTILGGADHGLHPSCTGSAHCSSGTYFNLHVVSIILNL